MKTIRFNDLKWLMLLLAFMSSKILLATEIVKIVPLTNKVIMVHFDDGSLIYPNTISKLELDKPKAGIVSSYAISSVDDAEFGTPLAPVSVGRKSKGTEFKRDGHWDAGVGAMDPRFKDWVEEHWIYLELPHALKDNFTYSINTGDLATNGSEFEFVYDIKNLMSEAIHVNTIGYNKTAPKYGYIYHWMGEKGGIDLSDYNGKAFNVYNTSDLNNPVKSGTITLRKPADNIETEQDNDTPGQNFLGSEVYQCDFSSITANGTYRLVIEDIGCSFDFKIGDDAVWDAYYYAIKGLYHQRSGIRLDTPYTHPGYYRPVNQNPMVIDTEHSDPKFQGTSFANKLVYSDFPYTEWEDENSGGGNKNEIRAASEGNFVEVAGWYHDAGDWDSYFTHHRIPAMLLLTYEYAPERFGDDELNIPESGNGIPDIVDEASWLIKFNYRLRKELKVKGYSDGGIGGARICGDVFNGVDGEPESSLPSWKETRRTVITQADAFMTYFYAGQAAHFAFVLKGLGKNAEAFPVEMLDAISYEEMTYDNVNWISEAEESFAWAQDEANQPTSNNHYNAKLYAYRAYAAANLYRLTNKEMYNRIAKEDLANLASVSKLKEDERWGVYSYLKCNNFNADAELIGNLQNVAISNAQHYGTGSADKRACRWGGEFDMPMLVGQGTTPWMFETIMAYGLTNDDLYKNTVHATADYFLGNNPLHTTWMVGVGPRAPKGGFHLDTKNTGVWQVYDGWIPYGPWSINFSGNLVEWEIDGETKVGGMGSWSEQWANFSTYPNTEDWPGHERWNNNIHTPLSAENTIHQNAVHAGLTYGFVNGRQYNNASADNKVNRITLSSDDHTFTKMKETLHLMASVDIENATFAQLKWSSTNPEVAYVDNNGTVTALTDGNCDIKCEILDGTVVAVCSIICDNLVDIAVERIELSFSETTLDEYQTQKVTVTILPDNASNTDYHWTSDEPLIASVEDDQIIAHKEGQTTVHCVANENDEIKAEIQVTVLGSEVYVVADVDEVIPFIKTGPEHDEPTKPEVFANGGTITIDAPNPFKSPINSSDKVLKFDVPNEPWKLMGLVLPSEQTHRFCQYNKLRFKYFGAGINDLWIQVQNSNNDGVIDITPSFVAKDEWQSVIVDIPQMAQGIIKQIMIFVNRDVHSKEYSAYFDDFEFIIDPDANCDPVITDMILDFENFELDWQGGYGSYAWNGNGESFFQGKIDNHIKDQYNGSDKIYHFERTGTVLYGGFGVVFPEKETTGWESFTFQCYATQTINTISFQPSWENPDDNTDLIEAFIDLEDLNLTANQWHTITVPFTDLNVKDGKAFTKTSKIAIIPGLNEEGAFDFYFDNYSFQSVPTNIASEPTFEEVKLYPNPTTSTLFIDSNKAIENIKVFNLNGLLLRELTQLNQEKISLNVGHFSTGMYLVVIQFKNSLSKQLFIKK